MLGDIASANHRGAKGEGPRCGERGRGQGEQKCNKDAVGDFLLSPSLPFFHTG